MPIYEYECNACKNVFEVQQRMTEEPLKTCPECQGDVKKLISASSFQLKGGGWYSDGYSGSSKGKDNKDQPVPKKETTEAPVCQKNKSEGCKSCPAAAA